MPLSGKLTGINLDYSVYSYCVKNNFVKNETAINAYMKKQRFGKGGAFIGYENTFSGNGEFKQNDPFSSITIDDKVTEEINIKL